MDDLILRGGQVVAADGVTAADVTISNGRIAALLSPGAPAAARSELRAAGKLLFGLSMHVHRQPGLTLRRLRDETRAAAME
jgi:dihydroorotase